MEGFAAIFMNPAAKMEDLRKATFRFTPWVLGCILVHPFLRKSAIYPPKRLPAQRKLRQEEAPTAEKDSPNPLLKEKTHVYIQRKTR